MAKLVEQGNHIIPGDQRGLPVRWFLIVADVINHRTRGKLIRLLNKIPHPRAARFGITREKIAVEQRHAFTRVVENLPHAHIRVVNRNIETLDKADTEQLRSGPEYAIFQHGIEREIGFDLRLIQRVFR
ncbi:Uncharacterised protein [Enterobacter hormaechei]|nr:Uncharacterised protein [Enterobacter hormaechei]